MTLATLPTQGLGVVFGAARSASGSESTIVSAVPAIDIAKVSLKDLQSQRFVMREEGSTTRRVFESELIARNINIQVALEMGSREAVREAVAQGIGLGVVAETAYVPDPRLVKLKILDTAMATHVDFICRRERQNAPLIATIFDLAKEVRRGLA